MATEEKEIEKEQVHVHEEYTHENAPLAHHRPTRVLLIYTGGTIGMKETERGYAPVKGYLGHQVASLPQFHDPKFAKYTMPLSRQGKLVSYDILEYEPLLDSSNMGHAEWKRIAEDIRENYDKYNAFLILHGTDTMAFTASALSFMLEYLEKPVILTGSQIPLSRDRNDAVDNLLGALTIAAHYEIPEVCIYFGHKLLRGNRTTKVDASGFNAFNSPNYPPLVKVGIDFHVDWSVIRPNSLDDDGVHRPFRVQTNLEPNVATLRIFPGIHTEIVKNFLKPPLQGLILETFGAGNAPSNRRDFLDAIKEATDRGVIIINVTQCAKGFVSPDYEAGVALAEVGVTAGSDMTVEAALTKLTYLLGSGKFDREQIKHRMTESIRGELTVPEKTRFSLRNKSFIRSVFETLRAKQKEVMSTVPDGVHPSQAKESLELIGVERALLPTLLCSAASIGDLGLLKSIIYEANLPPSEAVNLIDYDKRTPLHLAATEGHLATVEFLVQKGANVNTKDRWGGTALSDAMKGGFKDVVAFLKEAGGQV